MKKTSIYIMSIVVIGLLVLSLLMPARHIVSLMMDALDAGSNDSRQTEQSTTGDPAHAGRDYREVTPLAYETPIQVQFQASRATMLHSPDSLRFTNGDTLPFIISSGIVMVDDAEAEMPAGLNWAFLILPPLQVLLILFIFWKLIRFIINVLKERIFVIQNVRYLRQTSTALLLIAFFHICEGLCQDKLLTLHNLSYGGYEMNAYWEFPWNCIIIGALGFLFAQVWAYGLEIKQDQELTI